MNEELTWVLQAQEGSDEAFARIVEAYQTPVYNLCYRMLGEAEAAEDAAQETFLRVFQHLHRYDRKRAFATWLLSIAAHYCIDRLRRRKLSVFSIDQADESDAGFELPDPASPDPEAESIRKEERERLHRLLRSLEPIDRAAIVMRYWHDFSEAEIAESLDLSVSAVKSRLHRARRQMAGLWQEHSPKPRALRRPNESPAF
ncbi:MAG: RNA polymerase sigma factor [Bacteroidota bacterium]